MEWFALNGTIGLLLSVVAHLVVFAVMIVVILDNRNPVKTIAWVLLLSLFPFVGVVLYLIFGRSNRKQRLISKSGYTRLIKRPMAEYQSQVSSYSLRDKHRVMTFFNKVNNALTFEGNEVTVFSDGASMFCDMLREIYAAKSHIHLEFYILEDDPSGRLLRDVLIDKARQGVKVRVLYDDVGCWKVPHHFFEEMLCEGIEVQGFLKVRFPRFTGKVNYRNHRKIMVIDGETGYIGGMNIAQRYIRGLDWGVWRDTQVKIKGKAVYGLQTAFLTDWYVIDRTLLTSAKFFPKLEPCGNAVAQIVTSDPVGEWKDIMQGLMLAIGSAKKYLYIQTPYLIPTEQIKTALQTAALSGVDIRIMLPKRADTWLIHKGSLSYLDDMMKSGIKIYLYKKGFLHSKMMVCDNELSTVGSTNMDFRSFEHNFEANAFFYDKETSIQLKDLFIADQRYCLLLTRRMWSRRSWKNKVLESVVRLIAPVL